VFCGDNERAESGKRDVARAENFEGSVDARAVDPEVARTGRGLKLGDGGQAESAMDVGDHGGVLAVGVQRGAVLLRQRRGRAGVGIEVVDDGKQVRKGSAERSKDEVAAMAGIVRGEYAGGGATAERERRGGSAGKVGFNGSGRRIGAGGALRREVGVFAIVEERPRSTTGGGEAGDRGTAIGRGVLRGVRKQAEVLVEDEELRAGVGGRDDDRDGGIGYRSSLSVRGDAGKGDKKSDGDGQKTAEGCSDGAKMRAVASGVRCWNSDEFHEISRGR